MEAVFDSMMSDYDFMAIIIYPELEARRQFVHNAWDIAKTAENDELK